MEEISKTYLNARRNAWSGATLDSESYRLKRIAKPVVEGVSPEKLWDSLQDMEPYSRVTYWVRATKLYDYLYPQKVNTNPYRLWRQENAKRFKYTYEKKTSQVSYSEACQKISKIQNKEARDKAFQLLNGALRWTESFKIKTKKDGTHWTLGKGEKPRQVYVKPLPNNCISYSSFLRHIKRVGLHPHELRKIKLTDLARKGADQATLCHVAGWSSFETASSYIAPFSQNKIKEMMEE